MHGQQADDVSARGCRRVSTTGWHGSPLGINERGRKCFYLSLRGNHYAAETGITWYRKHDGCYVKYPERVNMPHKLWTVGKMDYRPKSIRGGPDNVVLDLPYPATHEPDPTIINNSFNAEAAHIQPDYRVQLVPPWQLLGGGQRS